MKKLFTLSILILFNSISFSQNLGIDYNENSAQIDFYLLKTENIVVSIYPSGKLGEFYIFDSESDALEFTKQPTKLLIPTNEIIVKNTKIYYNGLKIIDYYDEFDINNANEIASIGGIPIKYYSSYDLNNPGDISTFGTFEIKYYSNYDINDPKKIAKIGQYTIKYYPQYDINNPGKIKNIEDINIKYFDQIDLYNPGKISNIGDIKFEYYTPFDYKKTGALKNIKGTDRRFYIF